MKKIVLSLLLLSSSFTYAGNGDWFEKGNGGFVVLCDQKPPQTLDIFEIHQHQWTLDEKESSTTQGRLDYLIGRIKTFNPTRAKLYKEWAASFFDEAELVQNPSFGPMPDLGKVNFETCKPQHVIYQRQPNNLNKFRYTVNATFWATLSPLDQAGLILHELIYRELALPPNGHLTSEFSRNFNSWLNSSEFEKADIQDYLEMLQHRNVVKAEYDGYSILLAAKNEMQNSWSYADLGFYDRRPSFLVLDASVPLVSKQFSLKARCKTKDKLTSYGQAVLAKDGSIFSIDPISFTNANLGDLVESCISAASFPDPSSAGHHYVAVGSRWFFGLPKEAVPFVSHDFSGTPDLAEGPLSTNDFDVLVGPSLYPVTTFVSFASKIGNEDSLQFQGDACAQIGEWDERSQIILSAKSMSPQKTVWRLKDLAKIYPRLKPCK